MELILITEQTVLPITNIDCAESTKSNYANYLSASSTNCAGALIDIIKDVLIHADPTIIQVCPR